MKKCILTSLLLPQLSMAMVNLQLGSWEWSTTVLDFKLTYNSQSLYQGWWGLGWCSELETKLDLSQKQPVLLHCGKKTPAQNITAQAEGFKVSQGESQLNFDKFGRLISMNKKNDKSISLKWSSDFPTEITVGELSWTVVRIALENRVRKLKGKNSNFQFEYSADQLISISRGKFGAHFTNLELEFSYSEKSNLVSISANKQKIRLVYDETLDRVLSVETDQGCKTSYSYDESKKQTEFVLVTTVQRFCFNSLLETKQVEAQFDLQINASAKLKTIKEVYL